MTPRYQTVARSAASLMAESSYRTGCICAWPACAPPSQRVKRVRRPSIHCGRSSRAPSGIENGEGIGWRGGEARGGGWNGTNEEALEEDEAVIIMVRQGMVTGSCP